MSLTFPTHVWKMPNICKPIVVWLFPHMCAFSRIYVLKPKHVWKKAPRCKYTNMFVFFHTCLVKDKHLPNKTCVVFYTQVWLLPNIFVKSQTCVKIMTMSVQNILAWFFEGKKDSLIRSCSFSHNFGLFTFPFFKCCPHIL